MVTRHRDTGKGRAEEETSENTSLPLAVDAAMSLSPEELGVLQEQYLIEEDKGFVSTQTKFNLAWWVPLFFMLYLPRRAVPRAD